MSCLLSMHCCLLFILLVLSGFPFESTQVHDLNAEIDASGNCYWLMSCKLGQLERIYDCFKGLKEYPEICEKLAEGLRILASELEISCDDVVRFEFWKIFKEITCNLDDKQKSKRMEIYESKSVIYLSHLCSNPLKKELCEATKIFGDKFRKLLEENFENGNCPP